MNATKPFHSRIGTTEMPAYIIVLREGPVRDPEAYATYQQKNRAAPPVVALKPLVAYGAMQALEGEAPDGVVLLQFDSVEDARAWYQSPGYQDALPHRLRCADWRAFIVEGI
jgi:uncharacterized protein (DUF1330 family)